MSDLTTKVLHDVYEERQRQDIKWGGAEHDDQHDSGRWCELIEARLRRQPLSPSDDRRLLIETAALAVAAVETYDRRTKKLADVGAGILTRRESRQP